MFNVSVVKIPAQSVVTSGETGGKNGADQKTESGFFAQFFAALQQQGIVQPQQQGVVPLQEQSVVQGRSQEEKQELPPLPESLLLDEEWRKRFAALLATIAGAVNAPAQGTPENPALWELPGLEQATLSSAGKNDVAQLLAALASRHAGTAGMNINMEDSAFAADGQGEKSLEWAIAMFLQRWEADEREKGDPVKTLAPSDKASSMASAATGNDGGKALAATETQGRAADRLVPLPHFVAAALAGESESATEKLFLPGKSAAGQTAVPAYPSSQEPGDTLPSSSASLSGFTANGTGHGTATVSAAVPGSPAWRYEAGADRFVSVMTNVLASRMKVSQSEGVARAQVTLYPEHLGQIEVTLTNENGQLTARFLAETTTGKELLETNLAALRNALQQQGFTIDKISVEKSEMSQQAFHSQLAQDQGKHGGQPSTYQGRQRQPQPAVAASWLAAEPGDSEEQAYVYGRIAWRSSAVNLDVRT